MTNNKQWLEENKDKRQPTEVYSRVMGYHRPVDSWNAGKQQEWEDRQHYTEALCFPEDKPEDE